MLITRYFVIYWHLLSNNMVFVLLWIYGDAFWIYGDA